MIKILINVLKSNNILSCYRDIELGRFETPARLRRKLWTSPCGITVGRAAQQQGRNGRRELGRCTTPGSIIKLMSLLFLALVFANQ